jgi:hypothetical protein
MNWQENRRIWDQLLSKRRNSARQLESCSWLVLWGHLLNQINLSSCCLDSWGTRIGDKDQGPSQAPRHFPHTDETLEVYTPSERINQKELSTPSAPGDFIMSWDFGNTKLPIPYVVSSPNSYFLCDPNNKQMKKLKPII